MEKKINIKKWLLYTYVMLATMLLGTSCVMDNDDLPDCPPPTPKPNEEAPAVKAGLYCNDNLIAWEEGKAIGVYLIDNEAEKLLNDSLGAPYRINKVSTGLFLPQWGVGNQVIKRPALGVVRDALGIYPYGIALENTQTLSLSVADQTDQDKLDLFIPRRVKGITATTDTIRLDFHRRMSRLLFNLTLTEVKADQTEVEADDKLAGATILVNGLPIDGTFQLADEQLETGEATSFQAYTAANGKQGQAIVFPGPSTKDIRLQVSIPQCPDTLYSFVLDNGTTLESCHSYALDLDMKYVHRPVIKQYNVKYRYEGKANKDNVTVTRGTTPLAWGEGDIIRVDENSDFTFRYVSDLKVSVRTEAGQTLNMASGQAHTFNKIQQDITVIIHVDESKPDPDPEPEVKHQITYSYKGEANANNVHVFKNGMTTAWAKTEAIEVNDGANYTFGYTSGMIVTVRTKDGKTLSMSSGTPYTFTNITSDIEIIISAATPEYAVKYIFEGKYTEPNVKVEKEKGSTAFEAWVKNTNVYVTEGDNFSFKPTSDFHYTVTVNGKPITKNTDGSYTIKEIYENKLIVITTNIHKVTYTFTGDANENNTTVTKQDDNQFVSWKKEETGKVYVDDGKDFTFQIASSHVVAVNRDKPTASTYREESVSNIANKHHLTQIKDDIEVTISVDLNTDLTTRNVQYKYINQATATNTTVTDPAGAGWNIEVMKSVAYNGTFQFKAKGSSPLNYTVAVTYYYTGASDAEHKKLTPDAQGVYTIANITDNVMIEISVVTHKVSFTYDNASFVDKDNVPLSQNGNSWEENSKVVVEHGKGFTFTNTSTYTITVTRFGDPFTVAPGGSKTITPITKDVELVVTASICKVTYVFDEPTKAEWLDVKLTNGNGAAWKLTGGNATQLIESGKEFAFYTKPTAAGVVMEYVKVKDQTITATNNVYTRKITTDTEFHIKAVKTHKMTYEIKTASGTTKPTDFNVFHGKDTQWADGGNGKVIVSAGNKFNFGYSSTKLDDYTITVQKEVGATASDITMKADNTYEEANVQANIHYVITLAKKPTLTITITQPGDGSTITPDIAGGTVEYNSETGEFTPTVDKKWMLTVTIKGNGNDAERPLLPTTLGGGTYKVEHITKDTEIRIKAQRKPADMPIQADIHIWEELPPIDGGVIYPKTN